MAESKIPSNTSLIEENEKLRKHNEQLGNQQVLMEQRIEKMEALIQQQIEANDYAGPEPVVIHDPYDVSVNPHHIVKHPDGKILSWKNPNIRNSSRGWRGWVPITYDSEYGQNLSEYILDPPAKMAGIATQDNYVRRGTDSILCYIDEDIYNARQLRREQKALRKQYVSQAKRNAVLRPGVETFGDGAELEKSPPGGFKLGKNQDQHVEGPTSHRTHMFQEE